MKEIDNKVKKIRMAGDFIVEARLAETINTSPVEGFLITWSLLEQILLPDLIEYIAEALSLKEFPNLTGKKFHELVNIYYFLSHDHLLYKKLLNLNNKRNKLVHDMFKSDPKKIKISARRLAKSTLMILLPILDRSVGKITVPVLCLYSKGRKDMKLKIVAQLNEYIDHIEKDLRSQLNTR